MGQFLQEGVEMGEKYEAPAVIDLGSVAELTLGNCLDNSDTGMLGGVTPPPMLSIACAPV